MECLKDKENDRPTAEQLCSRLIALKGSIAYRDSLQQTPEEKTGVVPPARDQELVQQLRESELKNRPTAEQLCSRLIALKGSIAYRNSLQQTPEEKTGVVPPARDQELVQQLRESELRVEDLTREVQRLQLQGTANE